MHIYAGFGCRQLNSPRGEQKRLNTLAKLQSRALLLSDNDLDLYKLFKFICVHMQTSVHLFIEINSNFNLASQVANKIYLAQTSVIRYPNISWLHGKPLVTRLVYNKDCLLGPGK